jgi:hypothetical protein
MRQWTQIAIYKTWSNWMTWTPRRTAPLTLHTWNDIGLVWTLSSHFFGVSTPETWLDQVALILTMCKMDASVFAIAFCQLSFLLTVLHSMTALSSRNTSSSPRRRGATLFRALYYAHATGECKHASWSTRWLEQRLSPSTPTFWSAPAHDIPGVSSRT